MPSHPRITLDPTDHAVITALQRDGRLSVAALAREVSLSASATAGRLGRLTGAGVITGYEARVDPEALGYTITAFVRLAYPSGRYRPVHEMRVIVKTCGSACHDARASCPDSSGRSTSLPFSKVAPARTSATRCGAFTARQRRCADSMSLNAIAMPAAREPGPLVTR